MILEINSINCRNKAEIFTQCHFQIRMKPPLNNAVDCVLKFYDSDDASVNLTNHRAIINSRNDNKCSFFEMNLNANNVFTKVILFKF